MLKLILNIIAFILVIIVNTLAVTLPLNDQTTKEISDRLDLFITPAGYVFSIWSVIYGLLAIWIIRQITKSRRNLPLYQNTSWLFILSCILNSSWIFAWHYNYFGLSVMIMVCLLATLIALYRKIKVTEPALIDLAPFSIYLGWISIATIINITYYLTDINWNVFGISSLTWGYLELIVATILAISFTLSKEDYLFPLVFVWAFIGIGVEHAGDHLNYANLSFILAGFIFLFTLLYTVKSMRSK
ncbi:TspO/MBR family protein [Bacillus pinisoli]|uniref:TspO/MBR family protein n=1 Tax=Bacillus pinisoli TaxID=2901866 RepID=UPI001FF1A4C6|nr:TspO/MBR family protein [Bacillus pinisoli]